MRAWDDARPLFFRQLHRRLQYRLGRPSLSSSNTTDPREDVLSYLYSCPTEEFLDFLEDIFQLDCYWKVRTRDEELVSELNDLLRQDSLPFHLTELVAEPGMTLTAAHNFAYGDTVKAYPQVILAEDEILHNEAVEPALQLLARPGFSSANSEFLSALEDYRNGRLADSLTKCGSAFESTLKILCSQNGWHYQEEDTAGKLIKILMSETALEGYFEPVLMIIATLRNRLSSSHGAGTKRREVPRHRAKFAINATAAYIVLLIEESES